MLDCSNKENSIHGEKVSRYLDRVRQCTNDSNQRFQPASDTLTISRAAGRSGVADRSSTWPVFSTELVAFRPLIRE